MKCTKNCYWYFKCKNHENQCEYYDPIYEFENLIIRKEYEESLKERVEDYQEIIEEQDS